MKKILHVTNWYPNRWNQEEGIFIKKHFEAFSEVTVSHLINVQVRRGEKLFEYQYVKYSDKEEGYYFLTKIKSIKVNEILTTILLIWALFKSKYKQYDLLQVHIAYPLLIYYQWWKYWIKTPVCIIEHWSAYHFNFNLPENTNKLDRVKGIFKNRIPVITVSKALLEDIQKFSDSKDFLATVIPNIIEKQYQPKQNMPESTTSFFIVNIWRSIKNPFSMLEAFSRIANKGIPFKLKIGGYGELLDQMKSFVHKKHLDSHIIFLDKMNQDQIEKALNSSDAYLFSSKYETFSVACADALSCGCPLIGPPIPCILEYADNRDMISVNKDTADEWEKNILYFMEHKRQFKKDEIAKRANEKFAREKIQKQYLGFINENF
jgi:glycosyltransferase involved in cell wall biosynthesis